MEQHALRISILIVAVFLMVCSFLRPPTKSCNIREVQAMIGYSLIMVVGIYWMFVSIHN